MTSKVLYLSLCLLLTFHITVDASEAIGKSKEKTPVKIVDGQIKESIKGLNLIVDKRIEILGIVQLLAESRMVGASNTTYAQNIEKWFMPYKDHPVVAQYKKMEQSGFSYDAPVHTMLFLDANLTLVKDIDKPLLKRGSGKKQVEKFVGLLQDFDKETKFDSFFSENAELLHKSIQLLIDSSFRETSAIPTLEGFYGYKQNSYNIVLAALFNGGYGPKMEAGNGMYDIYDIQGAWGKPINNIPFFGSAKSFLYIQWHEFSHSFVNPLVDAHFDEFEKYETLFKPISQKMESMAYGQWNICLYEHFVRAVTTVLAHNAYGEDVALHELEKERSQGFIYIDSIYSRLLDYSKNRKGGLNFKEFFPEIIEVMAHYAKNPIDYKFIPTPNDIFSTPNKFVIIYSTQEKCDSLNLKVKEYAAAINNRFYKLKKKHFMADTVALITDLKDYNVVCYGSYNGNAWLKTELVDFPFKISDDRIEGEEVYEQSDLILIASWKNPDNPEKIAIIYTAQNAEQVVNINNVSHGSINWLIANGDYKAIKQGNYRFKDGKFGF